MFEVANRYTVLVVDKRDLFEHIEAASHLGLKWIADDHQMVDRTRCSLYIFFDEAGKQNYLSRQYGDVVDEIRAIIENASPGSDDGDLLKQIAERVGL